MNLFLNFIEAYLIYNILLISVEQQSICVCVWGALSHVWLFVTPWTVACQASIYIYIYIYTHSCCCGSVAMSCLTVCHPMDYSTPGEFGPFEQPHNPCFCCCSVAELCLTLSDHMDCSTARLPGPPQPPGVRSNSCPLSHWCHPTISSSIAPFSCPQFPSNRVFSNESALCIRWSKYWASTSATATVLPMNIQSWFPLGLTVRSPCSLTDSQESSLAQFESISSLALSLLCGPTLIPYMTTGKIHSCDYMDFVGSDVSAVWCAV